MIYGDEQLHQSTPVTFPSTRAEAPLFLFARIQQTRQQDDSEGTRRPIYKRFYKGSLDTACTAFFISQGVTQDNVKFEDDNLGERVVSQEEDKNGNVSRF